ncbi:AlpA family phage regulatory protein [Vreelandella andesensis]|uniref:AlpA family phage regulatory protein n=1 Tax=Vreelandella andesensis TaxID=447567 RepID=A0A3S0YVZ5_9GAMM|nr:AlpA family phage regulatory protein [Halomonas andesensis]RUR30847.1 AlpA family phage regulatory protein [Halomonas andesensis]
MTASTFLTVRQVAERLAISVPTVWRWSRERSDFPKPKRLGPAATRWRLSELEAWEASQNGRAC